MAASFCGFLRVGLTAVPMCYPSVIRSRQLMGHNEGNTLKSQANHEGRRALLLNSVEYGIFQQTTGRCGSSYPADRHGEEYQGRDLAARVDSARLPTNHPHALGEG